MGYTFYVIINGIIYLIRGLSNQGKHWLSWMILQVVRKNYGKLWAYLDPPGGWNMPFPVVAVFCFRHFWKTPSWKINAVMKNKCRGSTKMPSIGLRVNHHFPICVESLCILSECLIGLWAQPSVATISKPMPMIHGRIRTFYSSQS